jgi:hypothetical protein
MVPAEIVFPWDTDRTPWENVVGVLASITQTPDDSRVCAAVPQRIHAAYGNGATSTLQLVSSFGLPQKIGVVIIANHWCQ